MRKGTVIVAALATSAAATLLLAPRVSGQAMPDVAFWVSGATIDTSADVAMPTGPARSTNSDICNGTGDCPTNCPKPVQSFIFVDQGGGAASRLTNVVVSSEVPPGHKCRNFTGGGTCTVTGVLWNKYTAGICE